MTSLGLPEADSYRSYNTRAAGPERVSFSSFGADPEGEPVGQVGRSLAWPAGTVVRRCVYPCSAPAGGESRGQLIGENSDWRSRSEW